MATPSVSKNIYGKPSAQDGDMPAYSSYMRQAAGLYEPQRQAGMASLNAGLADKGLMASTGAIGLQNQANNEWQSLIKQWADERYQNERQFREGRRQYDTTLQSNTQQFLTNAGMRAWELLTSGALQRRALQGDNKGVEYPSDPASFAQLFKQKFVAPTSSTGPTGDPTEQRKVIPADSETRLWDRYTEPYRKDLSMVTEERVAADNAASRALQQQSMDMQREQFEYSKGLTEAENATDPYEAMTADARENFMAGLTTPGANLLPTQLLNNWAAEFGIDWTTELAGPNASKAKALILSMYPNDPERAAAVINRLMGILAAPAQRQNDFSVTSHTNTGSILQGSPHARARSMGRR